MTIKTKQQLDQHREKVRQAIGCPSCGARRGELCHRINSKRQRVVREQNHRPRDSLYKALWP